MLFTYQVLLEAAVRDQPHQGDGGVKRSAQPRIHECQRNTHEVERKRYEAFAVGADCLDQEPVLLLVPGQASHEHTIGDGAHEQDKTIGRDGNGREVILAHPPGNEWDQRQPEEEMQVSPQHPTADFVYGVEQVVMVVPINADIDKAQDVADEDGEQR